MMDWKLELVVVPVTDVDRAKAFYLDQVGFDLHIDYQPNEDFRVVQLNPPGSACSIALMTTTSAPAGSAQGLHLVVTDIDAARAELVARGTEVSDVFHFQDGVQKPGADPNRSDYNSFLTFNDPDGNSWMVQEVKHRDAAK
jgi:predicted enzyme related to lactoylglutathione lyase